jgi:hypothetical protein
MTLGLRILLMMELIIRVINLQEFQPTMEYWIDLKQLTVLVLTLVLYVGKSDE